MWKVWTSTISLSSLEVLNRDKSFFSPQHLSEIDRKYFISKIFYVVDLLFLENVLVSIESSYCAKD